jgi:neutral amino acid transport system permease protein
MVGYLVFLTINIGLFALFSLGLNLQWGFAGLINFGHVAFMTLGAYTTILLSLQGVPLLLAVAAGAGIAALLGLAIGTSTLRLREDYLAIVTIGTSELIRLVALNEEWLTRGAFGIQRYPLPLENFQPSLSGKLGAIAILSVLALWTGWQLWQSLRRKPTLGGKPHPKLGGTIIWGCLGGALILAAYINGAIALWNYNYKAGLMLLLLLVLALTYATLEFLAASPWGRILKAIREDEEIPRALGKNVFWYKLQAFMLGGAIAGISGAFFAWQLTTIYPNNFEPIITFYAWTIIVLGGAGSNAGTLLGAIIFWAYDSLTRFLLPQLGILSDSQLGALRIMIIGLLLILLMMWRPQGILGKKEELTLGR